MKVVSIQYLRAVAALGVVAYHAGIEAGWANTWPLEGMSAGVDIFFVISGFIMWITTDRTGMKPIEFWRRRIERIVPLYWIVTTLAVLVAIGSTSLGGKTNLWHVVSSYLFLPSTNPDTGKLEPIVSPGWSLNYEMFFYAIFGAALLLAARARLATTVAILALAVVLAEIAGPSVPVDFYGDPIVLEFLYGMCLGAIYTRWHGNAPVALLTALLAAAAAIFASLGGDHDVTRAVSLGIPAVLVVGAAVLLERTRTVPTWRIPYLLGGASYSIYLTHSMWLKVLSKGWDKTSLPRGGVFVLGVLGSAVVGVAVFQLVEQPITRWIKRRRQREDRLVATDAVVVTTVEG